MEENLDDIVSLVAATNHRAAFINQVEHAKQQYEARLQFAWAGHYFTLDRAFMVHTGLLFIQWKTDEQVILLDNSNEPVLIGDFEEFMDSITGAEQEALNDYYDQYTRLQKADAVEKLFEVT
jgi:hypothetical protein